MRFRSHLHRPTKHYDLNVQAIDEQLCELIAKRKKVSNNTPGFPPIEDIDLWAIKYGLYQEYLHCVFDTLYHESIHRPRVEPTGFRSILSVMRFKKADNKVFLITHLRQYENATVLYFQIDNGTEKYNETNNPSHFNWELSIGPDYDCYEKGSTGNSEHFTQKFVISPCLPDDVKEISFRFAWQNRNLDEDGLNGEITL